MRADRQKQVANKMNTPHSVTVRELTEAEAAQACVVMRVAPPAGTKFSSRATVFPVLVSGLTFATARQVVNEMNSHRLRDGHKSLWSFVTPDNPPLIAGRAQTFGVATCRTAPEVSNWRPMHALELPPLYNPTRLAICDVAAAVRDGNTDIWKISHAPLLWHVAALLLAVPSAAVPSVETEPTALAATTL